MQRVTGKPELMKQMNAALVCRALIDLQSATRAELAERTQISPTTVRTLLEGLLHGGDIIALQLDASSGGRRAQRYAFNPLRNLFLALYCEGSSIFYEIKGLAGNVAESGETAAVQGNTALSVISFIRCCQEKWDIRAVGLGVPGIVEKGRYYVASAVAGPLNHRSSRTPMEKGRFFIPGVPDRWVVNDIGEQVQNACHLPVILENDLNAIALGFARYYAETHPETDMDDVNLAYIHFNRDSNGICDTGAGIIADGKVVRGAKQFAGELSFLPMERGRALDSLLSAASDPEETASIVARVISLVNCVTNPLLVVIGGDRFRAEVTDMGLIREHALRYIPPFMQPEIRFSTDSRAHYLAGLSYLTSERAFALFSLPSDKNRDEQNK